MTIFTFSLVEVEGEFITFGYAEEVLLENVELILEAFDYLQLPFALNQGVANQPIVIISFCLFLLTSFLVLCWFVSSLFTCFIQYVKKKVVICLHEC